MTIKKQYEAIYALLEENQNRKVSTIMPQLVEMMTAKQAQRNFVTNEEGEVTHIFCYYHKKWESVEHYGLKKSSASGFNSMCKEGVNQWTKQNKAKKAIDAKVLELVVSGEIEASQIDETKHAMLQELEVIIPRADGHGED